MHEDDAIGIDLREEAANFFFTEIEVAVTEENVNRALDLQLKAGAETAINPFG